MVAANVSERYRRNTALSVIITGMDIVTLILETSRDTFILI